jgi:uncharacterized protein YbbK (DUF523 family)
MDLVDSGKEIKAISNLTGADLTLPVKEYAKAFFNNHKDIDLFIGKDRSPSCGVCSAKLYDSDRELISSKEAGLMAKEALERGIVSVDAEAY